MTLSYSFQGCLITEVNVYVSYSYPVELRTKTTLSNEVCVALRPCVVTQQPTEYEYQLDTL